MSAHAGAPTVVAGPREAARLVRFCAVGLLNSAVTLAAFTVLSAMGCPAPAASALAFGAGALNSFVCNSRWTFGDLAAARLAWWRFAVFQGIGALASAGAVGALSARHWGHLAAECAIIPCVTVTLYCLSRLFVFRAPAA